MQTSFIFHILGIVMWIGGLLALASAFKSFESDPSSKQQDAYKRFIRKFWFVSVVPGLVLVLASGAYQFFIMGIPYYMSQGWFHGKLTFLIVLFVLTAITWTDVDAVSRGKAVSVKRYSAFHGIIGGLFLLILILTYIGRGHA